MTYGRQVRDWGGAGQVYIGRPSRSVELPENLATQQKIAFEQVNQLKADRALPESDFELHPLLQERRDADRVAIASLKKILQRPIDTELIEE